MCELPIKIPDRKSTAAEVEKWWSQDRKRLTECARKHGLTVTYIKARSGDILVEAIPRNTSNIKDRDGK